ncbi:Gag-asp_proteas domain-containing protein [Quillaja saponaria]|uniref:Gag-asp_proteas domain-containing protein n=1 Tax=Quillaja saponaria TaxID=32244 RepID=A0AAD7VNL1_QUISA|nr:Gag-asp_proteas domain-containing protein [Quillaja saponaria]
MDVIWMDLQALRSELQTLGRGVDFYATDVTKLTEKLKETSKCFEDDIASLKRVVADGYGGGEGSSVRLKFSDPKPFNGTRSVKDLKNFIWDMEHYFQATKVPEVQKWAQLELRRQAVKNLSSAMIVADGLIDFRRDKTKEGSSEKSSKPKKDKVLIHGRKLKAMVDMGSSHCLINGIMAFSLYLHLSKVKVVVSWAGDTKKDILAVAYNVRMNIGIWFGETNLLIMPWMTTDLIIGIDFMIRNKQVLLPYLEHVAILEGDKHMIHKPCVDAHKENYFFEEIDESFMMVDNMSLTENKERSEVANEKTEVDLLMSTSDSLCGGGMLDP